MTAYTSFLAVDSAARADGRQGVTVNHPSPMPAGVRNLAVAGQARTSGVLGILRAGSIGGLGSTALGADADSVLGGLIGSEVGDAYGAGGFGLVGSGGGGGTTGEGTIGLGRGSIGSGTYGARVGSLRAGRGVSPEVIVGVPEVRGSLGQELIRRIIRRHINEVKFCYERELNRNARLQGRVIIQFTIGGNGTVMATLVQSSTLDNSAVEQCIAGAVRRWEFPKVQGAIAVVTSPFVLKPAGE